MGARKCGRPSLRRTRSLTRTARERIKRNTISISRRQKVQQHSKLTKTQLPRWPTRRNPSKQTLKRKAPRNLATSERLIQPVLLTLAPKKPSWRKLAHEGWGLNSCTSGIGG